MHRCKLKPFAHQIVGIKALMEHPAFFLADEMGAGKTLQVIVAAQLLHEADVIDRVVVVCPNAVRDVWYDQELGELAKHLWLDTPALISEYRAKIRSWSHGPENEKRLRWVITNYDFIRPRDANRARLDFLKQYCDKKTLLVLDESSSIKNHKAAQTKACRELRKVCGRVILLNGTPIANNPGDMFAQGLILDSKILGTTSWFAFRARYAVMGGWMQKQIIGWTNLEDLQRRFAPYVLRRLKKDCLDLPEKMPPVALTVPLSEKTWAVYKAMRDEMVAWLSSSTVSVAQQAIVKAMRLAQVTSGFIGGVLEEDENGALDFDAPTTTPLPPMVKEVGREKLDFFLERLNTILEDDPNFKCVVFCRFRPELERLMATLRQRVAEHRCKAIPSQQASQAWCNLSLGEIRGGQTQNVEGRAARQMALRLLDPRTTPEGPVLVGATPGAGSFGLNLTAANVIFRLSNDYSLMKRLQGDDRIHRPGQVRPASYFDVVATGPAGQRTIDHIIIKALRDKEDLATWVTSTWVVELTRE